MLLNTELIRQIQKEQERAQLHHSLGSHLICAITPEELERMEEEREFVLRCLSFNEVEDEQ